MRDTLKTQHDFQDALRGRRIYSKFFKGFVVSDGAAHFTIVTSKSVGNAVERNTIRRLGREAARDLHTTDSVLIISNRGAGSVAKSEIAADLKNLLRKV